MGSIVQTVEQLRGILSKSAEVVTPQSENYQKSIERWAKNAEKPAKIVIFPATVEDVSKAVLFSVGSKLETVTVGGRHSGAGASSCDGGICIDLGRMREVTVDADNKTVTAQGGCRWEDVDAALAKYGLAAVGGTVNDTGIGGLTLGGGYGWLTSQYGLVIDNLLEVEIVLVDGSVVWASETVNEELFFGIRGAGVNFGVVTKFTYKAYDQGPVWAGQLVFHKEKVTEVISAANHLQATSDGRSNLMVAYVTPPSANEPVILAIIFFNGTPEEGNTCFEPLLSLGPLANTTSSMPYEKLNTVINDALAPGFRRLMKGSSALAPLDLQLAEELLIEYSEFIERIPDANLSIILFEYYPYEKLMEIHQTAMAFANRGKAVALTFFPGWTKEEFDGPCREWARAMYEKTKAHRLAKMEEGRLDGNTLSSVGEYVNHDGLGDGPKVVYGVNFPRLKELKMKVDPENFFGNGRNSIIQKSK